jgi:hypothetical protein
VRALHQQADPPHRRPARVQMRDGDPMVAAAFSLWGGDEAI